MVNALLVRVDLFCFCWQRYYFLVWLTVVSALKLKLKSNLAYATLFAFDAADVIGQIFVCASRPFIVSPWLFDRVLLKTANCDWNGRMAGME
jgi:hypothetical protein